MIENVALKNKLIEYKKMLQDMKMSLKVMSTGNKQEVQALQLLFSSKKAQLMQIINELKKKLNSLNRDVDKEIRIRDTLLDNEQRANRRLKSEVIKAKDVLMSNELSMKAQNVFKQMVDLKDDEKVFLEDGSLRDLFQRDNEARQTFEYEKHNTLIEEKKKQETRKRYRSNQIAFRNLSNIKSVIVEDTEAFEEAGNESPTLDRKLMGQSVEWGRLPFELDSIGQASVLSSKLPVAN